MSIPTYREGFPQDGSSLGSTKTQIRANLDGTFETLAIDHVDNNGNPGSNPPGYHTVIHQVTQGSDPATISGVNQLYSKIAAKPAGTTQLFSKTGAGLVSQLTGAAPGYMWCSGFLIQFGTGTAASGSTISFPTPFPGACSVVVPQVMNTSNRHFCYSSNYTTTGFKITLLDSGGSPETNSFSYIAIGV